MKELTSVSPDPSDGVALADRAIKVDVGAGNPVDRDCDGIAIAHCRCQRGGCRGRRSRGKGRCGETPSTSAGVRDAKDTTPGVVPHRPIQTLLEANDVACVGLKHGGPHVGVHVRLGVEHVVVAVERQVLDPLAREVPEEVCPLVAADKNKATGNQRQAASAKRRDKSEVHLAGNMEPRLT